MLLELFPGGAKQFLSSHQARALIATIKPRDIVGRTRRRLVVELIGELEGITRRSGDQKRHLLSRAGSRRINRALHIMAVVQLRNATEGRAYFDAKKAAGKTSMEAMRALKRRLSNVVYTQMTDDQKRLATGPGGQRGNDSDSSATDSHPRIGSSDKPLPGPASNHPRTVLPAMP